MHLFNDSDDFVIIVWPSSVACEDSSWESFDYIVISSSSVLSYLQNHHYVESFYSRVDYVYSCNTTSVDLPRGLASFVASYLHQGGLFNRVFFYKYRLYALSHNTFLASFPFVLLCVLTWLSAPTSIAHSIVLGILRRLSAPLLLSWSLLTVGPLARLTPVVHKIYGWSFRDWSWFWRLASILLLSA